MKLPMTVMLVLGLAAGSASAAGVHDGWDADSDAQAASGYMQGYADAVADVESMDAYAACEAGDCDGGHGVVAEHHSVAPIRHHVDPLPWSFLGLRLDLGLP